MSEQQRTDEIRVYEVHNIEVNGVRVDRAYRWADKADWGEGPWQEEYDKLQWVDEATGLDCLAVRQIDCGHLCGYVGVPEGHPVYGLDTMTAREPLVPDGAGGLVPLDVHGGITAVTACRAGPECGAVCHVPRPGRPDDIVWVGFDCAHAWDIRPAEDALFRRLGATGERILALRSLGSLHGPRPEYRTLAFVMGECRRLAAQLVRIGTPDDEGTEEA